MSNFNFLKKNNEKLFEIIAEAERLFRDEYFEQSIVQTRRFAENLCKDLLQDKILPEDTFDTIIHKIKDNSFQNQRLKELSDDLFFIKKHGNNSAHATVSTKDGELALDCLERAYEIAIFYHNTKFGYDKKLDKTVFSEEMLMTGKKTPSKSLKSRYSQELEQARKTPEPTAKIIPFKPKNKKINPLKKETKILKTCAVKTEKTKTKNNIKTYSRANEKATKRNTSTKRKNKKRQKRKSLFFPILISITLALIGYILLSIFLS